MKNRIILIFFLSFLFTSCTLIKNQKSGNFVKVKYNSHLNLGKQQFRELPMTVESFAKEELEEKKQKEELQESYTALAEQQVQESSTAETKQPVKEVKSSRVEQLLEKINELEIVEQKRERKSLQNSDWFNQDDWWNDDVEDWPWLEITLAVIAVLVIGIIITWLVSLIGGVIASLLGLILLIALAYILYTLWIQ